MACRLQVWLKDDQDHPQVGRAARRQDESSANRLGTGVITTALEAWGGRFRASCDNGGCSHVSTESTEPASNCPASTPFTQ